MIGLDFFGRGGGGGGFDDDEGVEVKGLLGSLGELRGFGIIEGCNVLNKF